MDWTRRSFLALGPALALPLLPEAKAAGAAAAAAKPEDAQRNFLATYPAQDPALVRETVGVSHGNFKRVQELVDAQPSLARATWDWGFGDWETALGAASHVGNREIAGYLISKGARPDLFAAAMLGQLDVVKAFVAAAPGVQRIRGPHGITLLSHAKAGGDAAAPVLEYLQKLGDADVRPALVALTPEQVAQLAGVYSFGVLADERIEIKPVPVSPTAPPKPPGAELSFTRSGQSLRQLFHLGELAFYPAGAEAARIRFTLAGGKANGLTIHDPGVVLSAARIGELTSG